MKILSHAELNGIQFSKASSKMFFPLGFIVTYLIKPNCQTPRSLVVLLSGELAGPPVEDESLGGGVLPTIEWIKEEPEEEHAAMETKDNNAAPEDEERVEREEEGDNQQEEEVKEEEEEDEAVSGRY